MRLQLSCGPGSNESSLDRRFLYPLPRSRSRKRRRLRPFPGRVPCLFPAHASLYSCCPWSRGLARAILPASRLLVWAAFLVSPSLWERVFSVPLQSRSSGKPRTPEKRGGEGAQRVRRRFPTSLRQAPVSISGRKAQTEWPVSRSGSPADAIFLLSSPSVENTAGPRSASS